MAALGRLLVLGMAAMGIGLAAPTAELPSVGAFSILGALVLNMGDGAADLGANGGAAAVGAATGAEKPRGSFSMGSMGRTAGGAAVGAGAGAGAAGAWGRTVP